VIQPAIHLFTDEHIDPRLAQALASRGFDVLSCREAGRANQRISDDDQLAFAASQGRAILTFNTVDFILIDVEWKQSGRRHAGIIVSTAIRNLSDLIRRVEHHIATVSEEQQNDTLLWLAAPPPRAT
jgi:predicted nuclease of predicted toxin-antitoxin system